MFASSRTIPLTPEQLKLLIGHMLLSNSLEDVLNSIAMYTEDYSRDELLGKIPAHVRDACLQLSDTLRTAARLPAQVIDSDMPIGE